MPWLESRLLLEVDEPIDLTSPTGCECMDLGYNHHQDQVTVPYHDCQHLPVLVDVGLSKVPTSLLQLVDGISR